MSADRIEAYLDSARAARRTGDGAAVLSALDEAWGLAAGLPESHPLPVVIAWKRAKAHHDYGDLAMVAESLGSVVGREDLFDAYPHGIFGVGRACRAYQDAMGYGHPTIRRLWARLAAHHRESGDRFLAARAELQVAWDAACRGVDVLGLLDPVIRLRASDLEGGRSWHPEAGDAASSLPWLHLDAAHTALRAAVWANDGDDAAHAARELQHASDDLPGPPPPYVQHALLEAAHHGHIECPRRLPRATTGFDACFLEALVEGAGFEAAATAAPGPEWALAARWCGVRSGETAIDRVIADAERFGCLAFTQAASRS